MQPMKYDNLLSIMATDLGVRRYLNETDESFGIRTVYSASRFWIEAFCLDDGRMGADGCRPGTISRRLNLWLRRISLIYPFIEQWFGDPPASKLLYDKLIMVGDIISENSGGTYRCPSRHTIQISDDLKALLGVYDMTGNVMSLPISGMMLSAREHGKPQVEHNPAWWNLPREYHVWSSCTDERVYEYADPFRQNVRDCWAANPILLNGIGIGRREEAYRRSTYFLLRDRRGDIEARIIDGSQWKPLYTHLRSVAGNPYWAELEPLGESHTRIKTPFGMLLTEISRWLDFMTWPEKAPDDENMRIIRNELLETAVDMLESCGIKVRSNRICQSN